eukprot:220043-Chlamydomonas_euryale.AAC.1
MHLCLHAVWTLPHVAGRLPLQASKSFAASANPAVEGHRIWVLVACTALPPNVGPKSASTAETRHHLAPGSTASLSSGDATPRWPCSTRTFSRPPPSPVHDAAGQLWQVLHVRVPALPLHHLAQARAEALLGQVSLAALVEADAARVARQHL